VVPVEVGGNPAVEFLAEIPDELECSIEFLIRDVAVVEFRANEVCVGGLGATFGLPPFALELDRLDDLREFGFGVPERAVGDALADQIADARFQHVGLVADDVRRLVE